MSDGWRGILVLEAMMETFGIRWRPPPGYQEKEVLLMVVLLELLWWGECGGGGRTYIK